MDLKKLPNHVLLGLSVCFLLLGGALVYWLVGNLPSNDGRSEEQQRAQTALLRSDAGNSAQASALITDVTGTVASQTALANTLPQPTSPPLTIGLAVGVPTRLLTTTLPLTNTTILTNYAGADTSDAVALYFDFDERDSADTYRYTFAAATRFDTIDPAITWASVQQMWHGVAATDEQTDTTAETDTTADASESTAADARFVRVAVLTDTLPALTTILGKAGPDVIGYDDMAAVVAASWSETATLALVPFDLLVPRLVVLAVDGHEPIENANRFDVSTYPLVGTIYAHISATTAPARAATQELLAALPPGNRDPEKLTVIAMTGVTAMVRLTAAEMDKRGAGWPAEVVGPELAAADITAISNEVPFVPGCETDTRMDNLTFCSKPEYMQALTDS
ncbi:MAG: hypothetical protein KDE31_16705, partial [Caldilineaceae bacterium]|nr:hypothetical protein [Caldilineaceae bacterium]